MKRTSSLCKFSFKSTWSYSQSKHWSQGGLSSDSVGKLETMWTSAAFPLQKSSTELESSERNSQLLNKVSPDSVVKQYSGVATTAPPTKTQQILKDGEKKCWLAYFEIYHRATVTCAEFHGRGDTDIISPIHKPSSLFNDLIVNSQYLCLNVNFNNI